MCNALQYLTAIFHRMDHDLEKEPRDTICEEHRLLVDLGSRLVQICSGRSPGKLIQHFLLTISPWRLYLTLCSRNHWQPGHVFLKRTMLKGTFTLLTRVDRGIWLTWSNTHFNNICSRKNKFFYHLSCHHIACLDRRNNFTYMGDFKITAMKSHDDNVVFYLQLLRVELNRVRKNIVHHIVHCACHRD